VSVALLIAGWIGAAAFFSFVAAPAAFRVLPRAEAGRLVSAVFPVYHALGMLCAAACLAWHLRGPDRTPGRTWAHVAWLGLQATGIALLFAVGAVKAAREAAPSAELDARFGALHGASMGVNLLALVSAALALWLALRRP
jgi:hypothetical protein